MPINKKHFDKWVVVTSPTDLKTQKLCKKHNVEFVICNNYANKGNALNIGLKQLAKKDWLIQIDADIILPEEFRKTINRTTLKPNFLYGIVRIEPKDHNEIKNYLFKRQPITNYEYLCRSMPNTPPRFISGYFQMFTLKSILKNKTCIFPESYSNFAAYDDEFTAYWDISERKVLDTKVIHLPHQIHAINWNGRVSPSFDLIEHF
jgi:hypothetical protein